MSSLEPPVSHSPGAEGRLGSTLGEDRILNRELHPHGTERKRSGAA